MVYVRLVGLLAENGGHRALREVRLTRLLLLLVLAGERPEPVQRVLLQRVDGHVDRRRRGRRPRVHGRRPVGLMGARRVRGVRGVRLVRGVGAVHAVPAVLLVMLMRMLVWMGRVRVRRGRVLPDEREQLLLLLLLLRVMLDGVLVLLMRVRVGVGMLLGRAQLRRRRSLERHVELGPGLLLRLLGSLVEVLQGRGGAHVLLGRSAGLRGGGGAGGGRAARRLAVAVHVCFLAGRAIGGTRAHRGALTRAETVYT